MPCLSGLLTKKFVNLIKHAEDGILDLNKAADTLEVINLLDNFMIYALKYILIGCYNDTGAEKADI